MQHAQHLQHAEQSQHAQEMGMFAMVGNTFTKGYLGLVSEARGLGY